MKKNKDLPFYITDKFAQQSYYFILENYKALLYQKNNNWLKKSDISSATNKKKVLVSAMDKLHRE